MYRLAISKSVENAKGKAPSGNNLPQAKQIMKQVRITDQSHFVRAASNPLRKLIDVSSNRYLSSQRSTVPTNLRLGRHRQKACLTLCGALK
jgi:hypothetical protein